MSCLRVHQTTVLYDNIKYGKRYGPDGLDRGLEGTDRELPAGAQERFPWATFGILVETQGGISIVTTLLRDNINCGKRYGPVAWIVAWRPRK